MSISVTLIYDGSSFNSQCDLSRRYVVGDPKVYKEALALDPDLKQPRFVEKDKDAIHEAYLGGIFIMYDLAHAYEELTRPGSVFDVVVARNSLDWSARRFMDGVNEKRGENGLSQIPFYILERLESAMESSLVDFLNIVSQERS